ncbi:GNAT family N-acetyltransferase [Anaerotignum sp. MB30-C6]|uniref:GNAT family N-acetyltransferase n=1 Tax=Anaerotignum sp. MB30-C6 TaxID=3070814 RepID=UPI0027DAC856|nr:GNAT family N-acetyltransferase [Anaerotignum sp. MB30-C6]WMI79851.1 GNAT family N-acetyltransferase [Anaerotignum sp. MB30-C6]
MAVSIVKLIKQDMKYSSIICKWFYEWWGEDEGFTMEKMEAYVSNSICQDRIPQTHVLLEGKTIIGVYQLSVTDIDVRPDIYPWLINVYIDYPYRGKGYFKLLMASVKENCQLLGIEQNTLDCMKNTVGSS